MMKRYACVKQRCFGEETGEYTAYGIRVPDGTVVVDVSQDRRLVEDLVDRFNRFGVSPIHVQDILEDIL